MATTTNTRKLVAALVALVRASVHREVTDPRGVAALAAGSGIPSQRGESRARESAGGDVGIASPLTEADHAARTYHATVGELTSTDGLIVVELQSLDTMTLTDANGLEVVVDLDDPYA